VLEFTILAGLSDYGIDDHEVCDICILVLGANGSFPHFVSDYGARHLEAMGTLCPLCYGRGMGEEIGD
jgi:hypothetical protein